MMTINLHAEFDVAYRNRSQEHRQHLADAGISFQAMPRGGDLGVERIDASSRLYMQSPQGAVQMRRRAPGLQRFGPVAAEVVADLARTMATAQKTAGTSGHRPLRLGFGSEHSKPNPTLPRKQAADLALRQTGTHTRTGKRNENL